MKQILINDPTLRDGNHAVSHQLSAKQVAIYCEAQTKISINVVEQPGWLLFTLTSTGTKARLPSDLDREMFGYVNRALIEMQGGEIRLAEETDNGAIIQFALPKK